MKKYCFILFIYCAPLLFSNFGMVEYAVLHPKTKAIQTDSLAQKQKQVNLYAKQLNTNEIKQEEEKSSTIQWGDYLVMGVKAIVGFLLKLLAHF